MKQDWQHWSENWGLRWKSMVAHAKILHVSEAKNPTVPWCQEYHFLNVCKDNKVTNISFTRFYRIHIFPNNIEKQVQLTQSGVRQPYLSQLTRKQASNIFKAKTRMIDVKNNFRGKYQNTLCRLCNKSIETQEHILEECGKIQKSEETKVRKNDLFNKTIDELRETSRKIENILNKKINKINK